MSKRDYVEEFCKMFDNPKTYQVDLAKVKQINPLKVELRGIVYEKENLYCSTLLGSHERILTLELSNRNLHADYSHSDIENAKAKLKSLLKQNDLLVVVQTPDRQALIILEKVIKL